MMIRLIKKRRTYKPAGVTWAGANWNKYVNKFLQEYM